MFFSTFFSIHILTILFVDLAWPSILILNIFFFTFQESVKKKMSSLNLPTMPRLPSKAKFWKKRSANISEYDPTFRVIYLGNVLTGWAKGNFKIFIGFVALKALGWSLQRSIYQGGPHTHIDPCVKFILFAITSQSFFFKLSVCAIGMSLLIPKLNYKMTYYM